MFLKKTTRTRVNVANMAKDNATSKNEIKPSVFMNFPLQIPNYLYDTIA
jgi:hypothetical protein